LVASQNFSFSAIPIELGGILSAESAEEFALRKNPERTNSTLSAPPCIYLGILSALKNILMQRLFLQSFYHQNISEAPRRNELITASNQLMLFLASFSKSHLTSMVAFIKL
jgi:hypothetical protein